MFHAIIGWLGGYVAYFPLIIFVCLILGGFNLPISEDLVVVTSAILCRQDKSHIPIFYCSLYFGAIFSDFLVFFWGRLFRRGIVSMRVLSKFINEENTRIISLALQRYGFFTYFFSRFVPFGVRNVLAMTSGFVSFPFYKFALFDGIAAFCNISALFWLVYFLGERGGRWMKIIGVLFFLVFIGICVYMIKSVKHMGTSKNLVGFLEVPDE